MEEYPYTCFAFAPDRGPGKYVVAIKRGELGCFPTTYDEQDPVKAKELVTHLNTNKLNITEEVAEAMLLGSMFGWDCPGAQLPGQAIKPAALRVVNDADDYKDVDVYINVGGQADWLFTVSLDKSTSTILEAIPRYSASDAEEFKERSEVPPAVLAEFQRAYPEAIVLLRATPSGTFKNWRTGGTNDFADWVPAGEVSSLEDVNPGDILFADSAQFDALNLCKVVKKEVERGIFYAVFCYPKDVTKGRLGASYEAEFAVWGSELPKSAFGNRFLKAVRCKAEAAAAA